MFPVMIHVYGGLFSSLDIFPCNWSVSDESLWFGTSPRDSLEGFCCEILLFSGQLFLFIVLPRMNCGRQKLQLAGRNGGLYGPVNDDGPA